MQGLLLERFGHRLLLACGMLLTGASWLLAAQADSLLSLYLSYGLLGGLGTGIVYIGVVGLIAGWFPLRRGFAIGAVAAGYGMGAVLTPFPIAQALASLGPAATLQGFGLCLSAAGLLATLGLQQAPALRPLGNTASSEAGLAPAQMLRHRLFWLLFVMMAMMSTSGLMVISQMAFFARDFGISQLQVFGLAALPLALTIDRMTNGLTRPFFGWVSDRLGRENTLFIAFGLEALAMTLWLFTRDNAVLFVVLSGVVFFGWGEIFSLFPATLTDTFGTRHATTNYGFLYWAQGVGSIFGGPLASLLHERTHSWGSVFDGHLPGSAHRGSGTVGPQAGPATLPAAGSAVRLGR